MALILTVDTMAERYKVLPSKIMNEATTFDLYIMDAALSYHNYQHNKSQGKLAENYTVDDLQEIMKKARGE